MGLYFKNRSNERLWVAYAYHAPGCEGGVDWAKKGWYQVDPGGTVKVYTGWVGGGKFFWFAEADDLSPRWSSQQFLTHLPWNSFDWCWTTASTDGRTLGMRKLEISWEFMDYTIGLG
ncbi:DUF1036 domain-containing protein [Actinosynnema sp. NPDC002837]